MSRFEVRRIADPVHTSIGLSSIELSLINTRAFQRLRHVKQLGLAYLVYPGADYSRFSHSLGVCHLTGRILDSLNKNTTTLKISDDDIQLYRLAGLVHDIGHYPFSHTTEHAVQNYYAGDLFGDDGSDNEISVKGLGHEEVGKQILLEDAEIRKLLADEGIKPEDVYSIFLREKPPEFANLVSSDLDADRIDYLLRTAHQTGLPYGSVDVHYMLGQLRIDDERRICLSRKALRTADHFLLSRYFDYSQVAFHKTVAALELVLADVINLMLEQKLTDLSETAVKVMVRNGDWGRLDDANLEQIIDEMAKDGKNPVSAMKARSIVLRKPPKLVFESSFMGTAEKKAEHRLRIQLIKAKIPAWSEQFDIPKELWWVWDRAGVTLTKIGSRMPITSISGGSAKDKDRYEQAIRILKDDGTSEDIMSVPQSLMSVLSDQALYMARVYVLCEDTAKREAISKAVSGDLGQF